MYVYLRVCSRAGKASGKMGQELWEAPASCLSWCVYILSEIRHRDTLMYVRSKIITAAQTCFNVITHFLWEGPVEPRLPSLVAAVVACTTSITVPQRVFKSNWSLVLPSAGDSNVLSHFVKYVDVGCTQCHSLMHSPDHTTRWHVVYSVSPGPNYVHM